MSVISSKLSSSTATRPDQTSPATMAARRELKAAEEKQKEKCKVLDRFDSAQIKYKNQPSRHAKQLCFLVADGGPQQYCDNVEVFGILGPNARIYQLLAKVSRCEYAMRESSHNLVRTPQCSI